MFALTLKFWLDKAPLLKEELIKHGVEVEGDTLALIHHAGFIPRKDEVISLWIKNVEVTGTVCFVNYFIEMDYDNPNNGTTEIYINIICEDDED